MPEITVDALTISFGANRVLDDVGFTVQDREFLTLLGPSGCGKTTTLMAIAGFVRPDSGTIHCGDQRFFDGAAKSWLAAEDRNVGVVFQSYAVWPHMTVFDNTAFPLRVRGVKRDALRRRVLETLDLVEMADYAERYPHELSGGQQQRVALARALVYAPSVLLLDEPFSNLDAKLRERARTWLVDLQRELGLTTLFVTHDQHEALSLSDRIVVMNGGSVLQAGPPVDIYRRPNSRFVADFLGQCNVLPGEIASLDDGTAVVVLNATAGKLVLPAPDQARLGDRVDILVRPEAITLHQGNQPNGEPNTYPVVLRSSSYLGDHYVHRLDLAGSDVTATDPRMFTTRDLTAHIPPEACRAIPAS